MGIKNKKICIIATLPFSLLAFMKPHIEMLAVHNEVTIVTNGIEEDLSSLNVKKFIFKHITINRKISPYHDLLTLAQLYIFFSKNKFDVVHSIMPKTALLGMVAAFTAKIPYRLHTFTGQVWANKTGFYRYFLKLLDKLTANCATNLLADSQSQSQFLIDNKITKKDKIQVLGDGSICGVNFKLFKPNVTVRKKIRAELSIADDAIVYLFLGRLNKDKGIIDLATAFSELTSVSLNTHLLIVGPDEEGMDELLRKILIDNKNRFHRVGFTNEPYHYMATADILCAPSYREGFGNVVIEAAGAGIPAIASDIYGLEDAIENGKTGILHKPGQVMEIKNAMLSLSLDSNLRSKMSFSAYERAKKLFSNERLVNEMAIYYGKMMNI